MSTEYKRLQWSGQDGTWTRYVIVLIRNVSKLGAYEIIALYHVRSGNYLYNEFCFCKEAIMRYQPPNVMVYEN